MELPQMSSTADDWFLSSGHGMLEASPQIATSSCCRSDDQDETTSLNLMSYQTAGLSARLDIQHPTWYSTPFPPVTMPEYSNWAPIARSVAAHFQNNATSLSSVDENGHDDSISSYYIPDIDGSPGYTTHPSCHIPGDAAASTSQGQYLEGTPFSYPSVSDVLFSSAIDMAPSASFTTKDTSELAMHSIFASGAIPAWDHVQPRHARPLFCIFHYAGCTLRFASKNEWKRHIMYQHLNLQYWVCTEGGCGLKRRPAAQVHGSSLPACGSIFNRKDLYTQHIRRMHLMLEAGSVVDADINGLGSSEVKERMRSLQARAARTRCALPRYMTCPVPGCAAEFADANCWENWTEHVAGHMQRAAAGEEPLVRFGGATDWTLTEWAASEAVRITYRTMDGKWALCKPIHGRGSNPPSGRTLQRK